MYCYYLSAVNLFLNAVCLKLLNYTTFHLLHLTVIKKQMLNDSWKNFYATLKYHWTMMVNVKKKIKWAQEMTGAWKNPEDSLRIHGNYSMKST